MSADARELAWLADAVAAGVPGVTRVYPASAAIARAVRAAGALSEVTVTADGVRVRVAVGTAGRPAAVGAAVAEAVREALRGHGEVDVSVRVARATAAPAG